MSTRLYECAVRVLYSVAWWFVAPLAALYLLWRGLRQPEYRRHWRERFCGHGVRPPVQGEVLWLHAVSVGETRAAQPLIEALLQQRPQAHLVLTHMTPTGRAVGESLAQQWPGRMSVRYLPYELGPALRRFLREVRPTLGIVMETEVWPGLLFAARRQGVPLVLANARLSEKSAARAQRFRTLIRAAARGFTRVLAQSEADRARLARFYDGPIEVLGNLKFDLTPVAEQVQAGQAWRAARSRPALLLASSREGEEAELLAALEKKSSSDPDLDIWVVPRHPQRFDEVEKLCVAQGMSPLRRSALPEKSGSDHDFLDRNFFLGDSMGEMAFYYALADVTLMGGSFGPFGSQNLIESCAVGTPVIVGPSTYNFAQVVRDAVQAGAALQVQSLEQALNTVRALWQQPHQWPQRRAAAQAFAQQHRGATQRTVRVLMQLLSVRG